MILRQASFKAVVFTEGQGMCPLKGHLTMSKIFSIVPMGRQGG